MQVVELFCLQNVQAEYQYCASVNSGDRRMFGCQPNIISPDKYLKAVLDFLGSESSKLILSADCIAQKMDSKLMQTVMGLQIFCQKYGQL
jgi:hypothetical protein